jgi:hypothetical protein
MTSADLDLGGARPILVTGMPRSGTTWVGRILAASGEVGYINEPFNLAVSPGSFRVPVDHWYAYVTTENEHRVLPALAMALAFDYPLARELRRCRNRTDVHHTLRSWREFVRGRGRRPLIKEPHAVFSVDWFARRLRSDVVILVREPLAVVSSWKRLGWNFDFANLLAQSSLMHDRLAPFESEMSAALEESWSLVERVALLWRVIYSVVAEAGLPDVHLVRHEDLSEDPVGEYTKLYDRLGLSFSHRVAQAIAASSSSGNPSETTVERPHETQLDSRANLENWKHRLSEGEISRIRELTEEAAARFYPGLTWA